MDHELYGSTVNALASIMQGPYRADGNNHTWFIGYGSLRWLLMDKPMGIELDQDIDVICLQGEVPSDMLIPRVTGYGYKVQKAEFDVKERPLHISFAPDGPANVLPVGLDFWFWLDYNGYYWHTFDIGSGICRFKGIEKARIDAPMLKCEPYTWEETAPNVMIPVGCGALLDAWYPPLRDANDKILPNSGWHVRNPKYGQSKCHKIVDVPIELTDHRLHEVLK